MDTTIKFRPLRFVFKQGWKKSLFFFIKKFEFFLFKSDFLNLNQIFLNLN